jgi:CRP-like cAMP-binding protein
VLAYYEELTKAKFIRNSLVYELLSLCISNSIRLFQMENAIRNMGLFDSHNMNQIEYFSAISKIQIFQSGDVIIKEGDFAEYFYFIVEGEVEVALENKDFMFFDFFKS